MDLCLVNYCGSQKYPLLASYDIDNIWISKMPLEYLFLQANFRPSILANPQLTY